MKPEHLRLLTESIDELLDNVFASTSEEAEDRGREAAEFADPHPRGRKLPIGSVDSDQS